MSTMVTLRLGVFEKHTGRNEWYEHHGDLFQPQDLVHVTDQSRESAATVLRKPFRDVMQRLNLLGVCEQSVRIEFDRLADENTFLVGDKPESEDLQQLRFCKFRSLLTALDTSTADNAYVYHTYGGLAKFFEAELAPAIPLELSSSEAESADEILSRMSANSVLWLLAQNERNVDKDLIWDFAEHVEAGYSTTEEHVREVRREHRFLIVTEGTSDGSILEKAFKLRRPSIADFFYYIDVERERFPYPGHGGLRNFCRSLITIHVLNQTIILFDNNAAARKSFNETASMALPLNVRVLTLPNLPAGLLFKTFGPDGESVAEINGRAAAIETYLDLSRGPEAHIRWGHFEESIGEYHGELEDKQIYAQALYDLKSGAPYDFAKLDIVLQVIVEECVSVARARSSAG